MKFQKTKAKKVINILLYIVYIIILIEVIDRFGLGYGFLGLLLITFVTFCYKLYQDREFVMSILRQIELKTFGKTLDRENWAKGEMARKKIKIRWSKPKNDN